MEVLETYVIRTKYLTSFRYVFVPKDDLSVEEYLHLALQTFGIENDSSIVARLTDNMRATITKNTFALIVKNYARSGSFYINLEYEKENRGEHMIVTALVLERYLTEVNQSQLLINNSDNGYLELAEQKTLIRSVTDFIVKNHGMWPSKRQKESVARATIELFPYLRKKNSTGNGFELLVNNQNNGFIDMRLRNVRRGHNKPGDNNNEFEENNNDATQQIDLEDEVQLMKSLIVNDENMAILVEKLNITREYRGELIKKPDVELKTCFPYFFTHPPLMLKEYELKYQNLNAMSLFEKWPSYSQQLNEILQKEHSNAKFHSVWPQEIDDFLVLLKLFPVRGSTKKEVASHSAYLKSVGNLLKFYPANTPPKDMKTNSKSFATIVACGTSEKEILNYYIVVESEAFSIPHDFGFAETFDLYFKLHQIFDLKYEDTLKGMMVFMQNYVYMLPPNKKSQSIRMASIFNKLSIE